MNLGSIIIDERLNRQAILELNDSELQEVYRACLNFIAQLEHKALSYAVFSNNYSLILIELKNRKLIK